MSCQPAHPMPVKYPRYDLDRELKREPETPSPATTASQGSAAYFIRRSRSVWEVPSLKLLRQKKTSDMQLALHSNPESPAPARAPCPKLRRHWHWQPECTQTQKARDRDRRAPSKTGRPGLWRAQAATGTWHSQVPHARACKPQYYRRC